MKNYFNTTNLKGLFLKDSIQKATKQDDIILNAFKSRNNMSPGEVWVNYFEVEHVPITSIRRSINTLTSKGLLIKTEIQKKGIYGKPEYVWQLINKQLNLF